MRRIVLQMMTTLNGRIDDPMAWLTGLTDDQYRDVATNYEQFDTVIVGRRTFEEMVEYWPGALNDPAGTDTNREMARRMNDYRKVVFSRAETTPIPSWNNVDRITAPNGSTLVPALQKLKAESGADIHLAGGAAFAQAVLATGLVDAMNLYQYPLVSTGETWHAALGSGTRFELMEERRFESGAIRLSYEAQEVEAPGIPATFTELLG